MTAEQKGCDEYLKEVHEYIESLFTNPNYKLIKSYGEFTDSLAQDMTHVATGNVEKLKVLSNSKDDKAFDRAMIVLKSVDSFDKVAKMVEDLKPIIEEEEKKELIRIAKGGNPMEAITRHKVSV